MRFSGFEPVWSAQLGSLRNLVRQHVMASQLGEHLSGVRTVLDVGCGQGTQALLLAARGLTVTGVDPSPALLAQLRADATHRGVPVETMVGEVASLDETLGDRSFDLVCAHGLLMYLDDAQAALRQLAARVAPGGRLSFTVRNGDALAYRPGIRGEFEAALSAMEATGYRNDLGIEAVAHTRSEVLDWCRALGLDIEAWYGVRVFTDGVSADASLDSVDLDACLAAEVEAGQRDPYRALGSMLHFVAKAPRCPSAR